MSITFRGTAAGQDPRFTDATKRQLKAIEATQPKEYDVKVRAAMRG